MASLDDYEGKGFQLGTVIPDNPMLPRSVRLHFVAGTIMFSLPVEIKYDNMNLPALMKQLKKRLPQSNTAQKKSALSWTYERSVNVNAFLTLAYFRFAHRALKASTLKKKQLAKPTQLIARTDGRCAMKFISFAPHLKFWH